MDFSGNKLVFLNKLRNRIKNKSKNLSFHWWFLKWKTNDKKKNVRENFGEKSNELLNRISSLYRYCINSIYIQDKESFSFLRLIVKIGDA